MNLSVTLLHLFLCLASIRGLTYEELREVTAEARASCIASTGVSKDLIMDVDKEGKFADDENLKCYIKCVHQYLGLMGDDGEIYYEMIIEHIPEDYQVKYASRIRKCGTIYGSNLCETAWLTLKCYGEGVTKLPHP